MSNANVKEFAEQLSDLLIKIEDTKCEVRALLDAAKDAGIDTKALNKIAKELITEPGKLNKKYEQEAQLDMFRVEVGIFARKGLSDFNTKREAA